MITKNKKRLDVAAPNRERKQKKMDEITLTFETYNDIVTNNNKLIKKNFELEAKLEEQTQRGNRWFNEYCEMRKKVEDLQKKDEVQPCTE